MFGFHNNLGRSVLGAKYAEFANATTAKADALRKAQREKSALQLKNRWQQRQANYKKLAELLRR